jgi:hypothetical protein
VPMKSVHRMVHLADRPDGGVERACAQCGRFLVCYPHQQVVVLTGTPDSVHVPSAGFPAASNADATLTEFDRRFLRSHQLAW